MRTVAPPLRRTSSSAHAHTPHVAHLHLALNGPLPPDMEPVHLGPRPRPRAAPEPRRVVVARADEEVPERVVREGPHVRVVFGALSLSEMVQSYGAWPSRDPVVGSFIYVELAKAVTKHTVLARRADPRKMRTRIGYPGRANFE